MIQSSNVWLHFFFRCLHHVKRTLLLIFGALLIIAAGLMLAGATIIWLATSVWPRAEGQMTRFGIRPSVDDSGKVQMDLEYRYTVNGQAYSGNSLSPTTPDTGVTRRLAKHKRQQFPVGQPVQVIYDPSSPERSFLESPNLLWDVLIRPISIGCLGAWMIYLFVQTRQRKVPAEVAAQLHGRFADRRLWKAVWESVVDRDHVVLDGVAAYSQLGGLLAGWPRCQVALVASPNDLLVVPGPYTKRGFAGTLLTLVLEMSLSRILLPVIHGGFFLSELWRRRVNWKRLGDRKLDKLTSSKSVKSVSIDEAVVYGFDSRKRQLWFRLPEKQVDEFIQLKTDDAQRAAEFIGFVGLMQKANSTR